MRYSITRRINGKDTEIELTWDELLEIFNRWTSVCRQENLYSELDWMEEDEQITAEESEALQDEFDDILDNYEDRMNYRESEDAPEVAHWSIMEHLSAIRKGQTSKHFCRRDYSWLDDAPSYTEAKEINV